jgi:hypothetical protein
MDVDDAEKVLKPGLLFIPLPRPHGGGVFIIFSKVVGSSQARSTFRTLKAFSS